MNKPTPRKPAARQAINAYVVPVHIGDGREIEPGAAIPADVGEEVRKVLLATGFFG